MARSPNGNEPRTGEILPPDDHEYNRSDLSPVEFLQSVFRDQRVPLVTRIDAASKCAVFLHPRLAQVNQDFQSGVTIRIEGGLPTLPGTNIIMPGDLPIDPLAPMPKPPNGKDE